MANAEEISRRLEEVLNEQQAKLPQKPGKRTEKDELESVFPGYDKKGKKVAANGEAHTKGLLPARLTRSSSSLSNLSYGSCSEAKKDILPQCLLDLDASARHQSSPTHSPKHRTARPMRTNLKPPRFYLPSPTGSQLDDDGGDTEPEDEVAMRAAMRRPPPGRTNTQPAVIPSAPSHVSEHTNFLSLVWLIFGIGTSRYGRFQRSGTNIASFYCCSIKPTSVPEP